MSPVSSPKPATWWARRRLTFETTALKEKKKRVIPRDLTLTRAVQVIFEAVVFLRDGLLSYIIRGFCRKNTEKSTFHVQSKGKLAHLYVDTNVAHSAGTALHTIAIISFSNVGSKPLL